MFHMPLIHKYVQILENGDLLIKKSDDDSRGVFFCKAKNKHGADTAEIFFYPTEVDDGDNE